MAYDEGLAERLRDEFAERYDVIEKKMFGGLAFMVSGQMCCGIIKDTLMARVGPDQYLKSLAKKHVSEMDFTGKAMKGLVYIAPEGIESDKELKYWVELSLAFIKTLPPKKPK